MKYLVTLVLILLLPAAASTLSAQSTAPPTAQPTNTGVISGQVTLKAKPAPHVTMVLYGNSAVPLPNGELGTSTDANGVYRLTGLPAGSYWVKPMTPAFVEVGRKVTIGDGETADGIDFELVKGGVITGKITDVDGHPLIEEMVELFDAEPALKQTEKIGYRWFHGQTDDRGIYRIFGVAPGRYKVAVGNDDSGGLRWRSVARRYRRVFFSGVTDPGRATVIEVSEGSETSHVDITVDGPIHTFAASGVVLDEQTNKPAPNMQCWISSQRREFIPLEVISNSQGQFQIDRLLPGDYQVRAEPPEAEMVFAHGHHGHAHHGHAGHADHNIRAAYVHVLADAMTSVLAIVALGAGRLYGWSFLDPVMGIVGALVITSWSVGLLRSAGAVLVDAMPDRSLATAVRQRLEINGDRVSDLHLWRLGPGHTALIAAVVSDDPQAPGAYKERLRGVAGLSHITVEVHRCEDAHAVA